VFAVAAGGYSNGVELLQKPEITRISCENPTWHGCLGACCIDAWVRTLMEAMEMNILRQH